ncbi:unnamed protein product [Phytophthora lilii]|uniref:Unnamed protein product n=1 Tax=Phytophthora lilii TaxID=2077276 RepID=A0A9W7D9C5_9STRA|nr:unnamed protein product [Phytophthora lilii]
MDVTQQRTRAAPPPPPSPLKIQPEEYVDTPSSSATASPAESCASDCAKPLKPWERTASMASSIDSSETSEAQWTDDLEADSDEGQRLQEAIVMGASAIAASAQMQTLMRGMRQRVHGLQRLVQEAALQQRRPRAQSQSSAADMCSSCLFPVAETSGGKRLDPQKCATAAPSELAEEHLESGSAAPSRCVEDASSVDNVSDSTDDLPESNSSVCDDEGPPAITTLLNRIKSLQAQLKEATSENQQLKEAVHRLKEENARIQAQTVFNSLEGSQGQSGASESVGDQESHVKEGSEAGEDHDGGIFRLTTAIFGEPSAFQMVMKEDLAVLKNHERCQHKLHELWDVIRTLKTFVETHDIDRNAMKVQRDEAIAAAERADAENVKLASSSNPQQKIKYLQQVKRDNQALRRKNRALNVKIARHAAKLVCEKNGCSLLEGSEVSIDAIDLAALDDTLDESDDPCVRSGEELLHCLRDRSGVLEHRLERLRLARQGLPADACDSSDETSGSESELRAVSAQVPLAQAPAATSVR